MILEVVNWDSKGRWGGRVEYRKKRERKRNLGARVKIKGFVGGIIRN